MHNRLTRKKVTAIHQKIKNKLKEKIHKFTTKLVQQNDAIFLVILPVLNRLNLKSTLGAGWGIFKTALKYKCLWAGAVAVVNERFLPKPVRVAFSARNPCWLKGFRN